MNNPTYQLLKTGTYPFQALDKSISGEMAFIEGAEQLEIVGCDPPKGSEIWAFFFKTDWLPGNRGIVFLPLKNVQSDEPVKNLSQRVK